MNRLPIIDYAVIISYFACVVGVGLWLGRRRRDTDEFMTAGRSLAGWTVGLSMFGSYISSISFLANPGKSYAGNWNPFVFSLATPIAAAIAVRWFMPYYRSQGHISAYEHLEHRFGPWARTYAMICFLLTQMARTGTIIYLLALAVAPLTGWKVETTILLTGTLMTFYTLAGGVKAAVWTGVIQSVVLIAGPVICLSALLLKTPGGVDAIIETGRAADKFSLGDFGSSLAQPTFWVVFVYGLAINLANFGTDQSYVQRYIVARSDREAAKSIWLTAFLYVPVAAVFFFIGTGLFAFYGANPQLLGSVTEADKVFPHFISTELPAGLTGLVIAAIFAASMDSTLSSMATLTLCDFYKRYIRPRAGETESLRVLYLSTVGWGALSIGVALAMIEAKSALDVWWELAGIFSGGVLGLFLLGRLMPTATSRAGLIGVGVGVLLILWMSLSPTKYWPDGWQSFRNPMNGFMTIVVGTLVILGVGTLLSWKRKA